MSDIELNKTYVNTNFVKSSEETVLELPEQTKKYHNLGIFQNYLSCDVDKKKVKSEEEKKVPVENVIENQDKIPILVDKVEWNIKFDGFKSYKERKTHSSLVSEKLIVEVYPKYDTSASIYSILDQKVSVIGFNLLRSCTESVKKSIADVRKAYSTVCTINDRFQPLSIFAIVSPRKPSTGFLKGRHTSFHLEQHAEVVITADRRFASLCCKKVIYINATTAIGTLNSCSIIIFGDVRLQVVKQVKLSAICRVAYPGEVTALMPVRIPRLPNIQLLTVEEIEDFKFVAENDIQIIVTPKPGCPGYLETMKEALKEYQCNTKRLFTRVILEILTDCSNAIWIANNYDGFFVQVFEVLQEKDRLISLKPAARCFLDICYLLKKPIIFLDFYSTACPEYNPVVVNIADQGYFYYLPDKFLLPSMELSSIKFDKFVDFFHIYDAERESFVSSILAKQFNDNSTTGSDSIAFGAIRAAYQGNVSVIIVDTVSGMMPVKLSHFKPFCRIIAVTENERSCSYLNVFHHIFVVLYKENNETEEKKKAEILRKLYEESEEVCVNPLESDKVVRPMDPRNAKILDKLRTAIEFCLKQKFISNGSNILFMFRSIRNLGYPNKSICFEYNEEDFETVISNIFK